MQPDTITLSPEDAVAEGAERWVYVHPDDPHRLIKVMKPQSKKKFDRWTFGDLTQRYFPATRWRATLKQYDEYRRLMLNNQFDPDFHLPIAHLYGFVKTNLGLGGITERVTDPNGNNAPTLQDMLRSGRFSDANLVALNAFVRRLYDVSICTNDVGAANFVYGHRHIAGKGQVTDPEWVLVDGFGDRFAITIRSVSHKARTLGLDDCFKRAKKVAGLTWVPEKRAFQLTP